MSGHGCAGSVVAAPESGANIGTRSISASPAAGTGPLRDSTADAERRRSLGASRPWRWGRRIGEPSTLAYGVLAYVTSHHSLDFTPEQAEVASELIRVALQGRDLERAVEGYDTHLLSSIELVEGYDTTSCPRSSSLTFHPRTLTSKAMTTLAHELRQRACDGTCRLRSPGFREVYSVESAGSFVRTVGA